MLYLERVAELGTQPPLVAGTAVFVAETQEVFYGGGTTTAEVAARLGWPHANVWLRERERATILERHPVFPDLCAAIQEALQHPLSVHEDRKSAAAVYFIVSGAQLRALGLLASSSTRYVDAVLEWRQVSGGAFLRLFHFGPVKRNKGGRQIWP